MEKKYHTTAGCFLIRDAVGLKEICLIYKKWSEDNQGWVPPKGHIEDGESIENAALRETTEETGYKNIKIIRPLKTVNIEYDWVDGTHNYKKIYWFLAELINNEKQDIELIGDEINTQKDIRWFLIKDAIKVLKFDDERDILSLI